MKEFYKHLLALIAFFPDHFSKSSIYKLKEIANGYEAILVKVIDNSDFYKRNLLSNQKDLKEIYSLLNKAISARTGKEENFNDAKAKLQYDIQDLAGLIAGEEGLIS